MRDSDWEIIVSLHQTKNITKTANLLFITQPTLTKRIQTIEEDLGIQMVIRNTKGITFTPEGEVIARKAASVLRDIQDIRQSIVEMNGGRKGLLKLGSPNSYVRYVIPELLKQFSNHYSDIKLEIVTDLSHELLKQVENRQLNASFYRGDASNAAVDKILISTDQVYAISRTPFKIEDLPSMKQIDYMKEPTILKNTEKWWTERFSSRPDIWLKVNNGQTCIEMIKKDLGFGIFPDTHFFPRESDLYSVPLFFKNGKPLTRDTWLVYHKDDLANPILKNFVDFVKGFDFSQLD